MLNTPSTVLFVSRRNSLRSVLAQACLNHLAKGKFRAYSCGVPGAQTDSFHPAAIRVLRQAGMAQPEGAPRDWAEFLRSGAPSLEFVITLDTSVATVEPAWPGQPEYALWHVRDLLASGDATDLQQQAVLLLDALRRRLELLVSLPLRGRDRAAVRSDLRDLGYLV